MSTGAERQKALRNRRKLSEMVEVRLPMPGRLHTRLKREAALAGMTLAAYLLLKLTPARKK